MISFLVALKCASKVLCCNQSLFIQSCLSPSPMHFCTHQSSRVIQYSGNDGRLEAIRGVLTQWLITHTHHYSREFAPHHQSTAFVSSVVIYTVACSRISVKMLLNVHQNTSLSLRIKMWDQALTPLLQAGGDAPPNRS